MWEPQFEALGGTYRLVALDYRGFGHSGDHDGTLTTEVLASDAVAVLDRIRVERAVVAGLSMGGYVALAFAREHPERLAGLVLADTRAGADTEEVRRGRYEMIKVARSEGASAIAEKMLPKLLSERSLASNAELVARVRRMIEDARPSAIAAALEAMASRPDSGPVLGGIDVPALVIVGSDDAVTPPEEARRMASAIPGAQFEEIAGAGHLTNLESATRFNELLDDFLRASRV
jgi:pimeloyl-ACP methyl ester carboxylesterase